MLGNLLKPFTTAAATGVAFRYLSTVIGAVLALLGVFGLLSPEQVAEITRQVPELLAALGGLYVVAMTTYATLTKSSSDKAAEAAKEIDARVPVDDLVVIKTPAGVPDIVVHPQ